MPDVYTNETINFKKFSFTQGSIGQLIIIPFDRASH